MTPTAGIITPAVATALTAFVAARETYRRAAAYSKAHWYDADARARCHLAAAQTQRAEQALVDAYRAAQENTDGRAYLPR